MKELDSLGPQGAFFDFKRRTFFWGARAQERRIAMHFCYNKSMNEPRKSLEACLAHSDFVNVTPFAGVAVDLRYGTTNNLLGKDVYGGFQQVILHKEAAKKFRVACELLASRYRGKFLVFDALRPQSAQRAFWDLVKGTPQQPYFADPAKGSIHSFGFAIDLSLQDENGQELDMGTAFDELSALAEPRREEEFLASGALSQNQVRNRKLLRSIMQDAGFFSIPHEWWHFDALPPSEVRANYRLVE